MSVPHTAKLYRGRVADQIAEDLREQILSGALPDGSRLPAERELATSYDVSGPTIREAIRVLTAMGLVSTRNGSRATVTAQGDTLLAMSIASVVQFEKVGAREVLGLLGALNAYAAELAAEHASDEEIADLRAAAEETASTESVEQSSAALRHFFVVLSAISHNPLLAALCRFTAEVQIGLAVKLSRGEGGSWGQVAGALHPERLRIVDAIAGRDPAVAASVVRDYHRHVVERIRSVRKGEEPAASDAGLTEALTAWLRTNVGLGGQAASRRTPQS
ncbi:MAG: GntR family transcriptional regulator, transcriptional repressor for pyruvate dehydrogenase complex [Streptomycetaceae bacterium]|jgi:GntR family transcriptional repressor for pyruvate dehydrogenase complex|nr:GntR family transcriptional regulator, transcriptional repressor for pyruvate dehydrogenase complex [Streptomycetaceae bacterium]